MTSIKPSARGPWRYPLAAIVDVNATDLSKMKFAEDVAVNRGIPVRIRTLGLTHPACAADHVWVRFALIFLLLTAATSAAADWVKMGHSARTSFRVFSDETAYYIDPATITSEGSVRRVWEIHDLGDKGPDGERSVLASVEYDCADNRMRTIKATGKSARMAGGQIIPLIRYSDEWIILQRGRDDDIFFKILARVCAR